MRDLGARAGATSSFLVRRGGVKSCRLRIASAQSRSIGVGERRDSGGHGRREHPLLGRRASSQCRRHGQGEVGAGPRLPSTVAEGERPAGRELPGYFRRRRRWRLRRRRACRLDGTRQSSGIRPGDGRQHRRSHRALRLPWTALRRCAEEGVHRVRQRATSPLRAR